METHSHSFDQWSFIAEGWVCECGMTGSYYLYLIRELCEINS